MNLNLAKNLKNFSVLYIEDEDGLRQSVFEMLNLFFKKVYLAQDGQKAFEILEEITPDLIITDIKMPKIDGISFIKQIRQNGNQTPIIIISAYTETDDLLEAVELSIISYVTKPITETKLTIALEKFLKKMKISYEYKLKDGWSINFSNQTISSVDKTYTLTSKESKFLQTLVLNKGFISYSQMESELWQNSFVSDNAMRLFIKNLRKKCPKDFLQNIQNKGYKIQI